LFLITGMAQALTVTLRCFVRMINCKSAFSRAGGQVKMNDRKDKKLFFRVKKKDRDAFLEAYDLYTDDIYRFIYFKVGGEDEAKDLTSAVFLKVWNYVQSRGLDESKSLRAFIYKVARNSIIDHYRLSKQPSISIDDEEVKVSLVDESQDVESEAMRASDMELIKKALPKLKDEYREVILMHYVDDLSFAEISEITGKSQGNVRVMAFRALKALKDIIEEKK
jgi:RNA polymerase sigma-70 factor, ECF subfamily